MNTQLPTSNRSSFSHSGPVPHTRVILVGDSTSAICLLNPGSANFPVLIDSSGVEVKYIQDDTFLSRTAEIDYLQVPKAAALKIKGRIQQARGSMSSYVNNLWNVPLLTRDEELHHFRKMHFLRFQSAQLQIELSTCRGHAGMLPQVEAKLQQSSESRKLLIEANLRLVVSIAKKYANVHLTLDELVSVGNTALVNAVDQFDYRRGFRFSTYAYQAIQRSIFGALRSEYRKLDRFPADEYEVTQTLTKDASCCDVAELQIAEARVEVQQLLNELKPRERTIVMARFGLLEGSDPSSFQQIGRSLGLSKQRVATIFSEAMSKLRQAFLSQTSR
jgi:RNA polymerase primary sigma factor